MTVTTEQMLTLAKRLRSRAYWMSGGSYYYSEHENTRDEAIKNTLEAVAGELDALFDFDSSLTMEEMKRRY